MSKDNPESTPRSAIGLFAELRGRARPSDFWLMALPCVLLFAAVVACLFYGADLRLSKCCYCEESDRWPLARAEPWRLLYRHGCDPAICLGVTGLIVGLAGMAWPSLKDWRRPGLFLAATLALGPGLIINGLLKPWVGRPRPCETTDFGGEKAFAYYGSGDDVQLSKSFPSGHASMGFFFMTPALLLHRRRPRLAAGVLAFGASYGLLIGAARVLQGAHFVTDVLASALLVYLSAIVVLGVTNLIQGWGEPPQEDGESSIPPRHLLALPERGAPAVSSRRAA